MVLIRWPALWYKFLQNFAIVNIDLMSLIGASCIQDYSYYASFGIMVCLPIFILFLGIVNFHYASGAMNQRLKNMSEEEKITTEKEALHRLFELADTDGSGAIDPCELVGILKSLGWNITVKKAHQVVESLCEIPNKQGLFELTEKQFLNAMLTGTLQKLVAKDRRVEKRRSSIFVNLQSAGRKLLKKDKKGVLSDRNKLIKWTLRNSIVANSLSGAVQLLMLAHTPVSRKVFQYFNCNMLAGKYLLQADYNVDCNSEDYFAFMPAVLCVLVAFTCALPCVISYYLWRHRKELYSTSVYQTIGWLCKCFVFCFLLNMLMCCVVD